MTTPRNDPLIDDPVKLTNQRGLIINFYKLLTGSTAMRAIPETMEQASAAAPLFLVILLAEGDSLYNLITKLKNPCLEARDATLPVSTASLPSRLLILASPSPCNSSIG